jgi:DNA replication protein DnaC
MSILEKTRNLPRAVHVTLQRYELEETDAFVAVRKWVESDEAILLLIGGVGTGKSMAAAWAVYQAPPGSRWITSWELQTVDIYKGEFETIKQAPVLAIDDLGIEYGDNKGYFASNVDGLLSYRIAYGHKTVITANFSKGEIATRLGARISDRIRESGSVVAFGSESLRGKLKPTRLKFDPDDQQKRELEWARQYWKDFGKPPGGWGFDSDGNIVPEESM